MLKNNKKEENISKLLGISILKEFYPSRYNKLDSHVVMLEVSNSIFSSYLFIYHLTDSTRLQKFRIGFISGYTYQAGVKITEVIDDNNSKTIKLTEKELKRIFMEAELLEN